LAASRSWTEATVTSTVSSRPMTSTAMCRLVPLIFFPASADPDRELNENGALLPVSNAVLTGPTF
jgi:hypothetical protein